MLKYCPLLERSYDCLQPILEYADFLIDSCTQLKIDKLDHIQKRSVRIIDGYKHRGMKYEDLLLLYGLEHLGLRRKQHHLAVMYRHSKSKSHLDDVRPEMILRNKNKVRFKTKTTQLTKVQKSPYYRGVS